MDDREFLERTKLRHPVEWRALPQGIKELLEDYADDQNLENLLEIERLGDLHEDIGVSTHHVPALRKYLGIMTEEVEQ